MIERKIPVHGWPTEKAAIIDINAIAEWVTDQRPKTVQYPAALPLIEKFESWYGALYERQGKETPVTTNPIGTAEVNEARRQRLDIQAATGNLPDSSMPAQQAPPDIPPPQENLLTVAESAIKLGAAGIGIYLIIKLLK
jgi:hypothetical protein